MNDPITPDTATPSSKTNNRHVIYLPPDTQAIKEYAQCVCTQLQEHDGGYATSEVETGFAFFLEFAIERLCHYASNDRLTIRSRQGTTSPNNRGGQYVENNITKEKRRAHRRPLLHP